MDCTNLRSRVIITAKMNIQKTREDSQGFIPLLIFMLVVLVGIIVMAYLRVANVGK